MPSTINASTSSGIVQTADTSGVLELQSAGTTKLTVASTGAYGQLISGTAVASTSGTSIDFTSIPSWVKRITVMFNGVSTNGTSDLLVQIGSGSVTTSGYGSNCHTANSANASSTAGYRISAVNASNTNHYGLITIALIGSNTYIESHSTGGLLDYSSFGGGGVTLGGTLDRVRITTVNGTDTFDAGSINILYEG